MKIICYSCGRGEKPENTIEGIQHCQTVNPSWRIEMDVQLTKDHHLVLFHDYNTKRTTGQDKLLSDLDLSKIKELNPGYNFQDNGRFIYRSNPIKIPELREVFAKFPTAKLMLDIHTDNPIVVKKLLELIETEFQNGDFIIVSEYDDIIEELKRTKPNWRYGVPAKEAKRMVYSSFLYLDRLFPIKSDILMIPNKYGKIQVLTKRVVKHVKKRNKEIWAWMYEGKNFESSEFKAIESIDEMHDLGNRGVTGVFTEFPEKLFNDIG